MEANQQRSYRAYRVNAGHRITASPTIIEALDDESAIAQAGQMVDSVGIELWERARCVMVFPPKDQGGVNDR